jgi:hypothetical protein
MKRLGVWLYRYVSTYADHVLQHVSAALDAMAPALAYRPALQRVSTPVSRRGRAARLRGDFLMPWI